MYRLCTGSYFLVKDTLQKYMKLLAQIRYKNKESLTVSVVCIHTNTDQMFAVFHCGKLLFYTFLAT